MKSLLQRALASRLYWAVLALVLLVGLAYHAKGHYLLVFGDGRGDAVDLKTRWVEHRYFLSRINPYDAWLQRGPFHDSDLSALSRQRRGAAPDLGWVGPTTPPWSYGPGLLLFWPAWPATRAYYSVINLLASAALATWNFSALRKFGLRPAALAAATSFALGGAVTALEVGQYTLVVIALLAGVLAMVSKDHDRFAGVLLGLALIKPTIAAPFVLAVLTVRSWRCLISAGTVCAVFSAVTYLMVRTTPWEMLQQMSARGRFLAPLGSTGLTQAMSQMGISDSVSTLLPVVLVMGVFVPLLWASRKASLLTLFGIASVAGRLWSYHHSYDDPMLVFLLVALAWQLLAHPGDALLVATAAVFVSLAMPATIHGHAAFQIFQIVTWLAGAAVLFGSARRNLHHPVSPVANQRVPLAEPSGSAWAQPKNA